MPPGVGSSRCCTSTATCCFIPVVSATPCPTQPLRPLTAGWRPGATPYAAILMPRELVLAISEVGARRYTPDAWSYEALRAAAAPFGVSAEAFLRRLVTLDRVPVDFYQARREEFLAAYVDDEARSTSSGGNWYRNTARDLGKGYVRKVASAHRRRVIDSYTAASFLNVKVGQIDRLAEAAALQITA